MNAKRFMGSALLAAAGLFLGACGGTVTDEPQDMLGEAEQQVWYCNLDYPEFSQCPTGYYCYQPSHECRRSPAPVDL